MYLYYATTVGDFERVIEHWILEEEWVKAIEIINRQVCSAKLHHLLNNDTHHLLRLILNYTIGLDQFSCAKFQKRL